MVLGLWRCALAVCLGLVCSGVFPHWFVFPRLFVWIETQAYHGNKRPPLASQ